MWRPTRVRRQSDSLDFARDLIYFGVAAGLAGAFGLTRLMESLLNEVKPGDPISFFGVAAILLVVALLAVLIPARRAISLDPVAALRSE